MKTNREKKMRDTKVLNIFKNFVSSGGKIIWYGTRAYLILRLALILNKENKIFLIKHDLLMVLESSKELQDRYSHDEEKFKLLEGYIQDLEFILNNI